MMSCDIDTQMNDCVYLLAFCSKRINTEQRKDNVNYFDIIKTANWCLWIGNKNIIVYVLMW